ncbi:MAG TPA: hypothetical protein ENJ31_13545 [Anaerolineae bacterium]|nr:hypothetical protein [Anaerolineae bacterium]
MDGEQISVPALLSGPVRWLLTEAAQAIQQGGAGSSYKIIIHLGRGKAPAKAIIERHQVIAESN